ncbi:MAG: phage portal protein [Firmicutes bacterium HGW-Firmicutes-16]|nr:MAG: phage portal protein [Firmicutes bacterium HGW-Firmicutes-16]
MIFDKSFRPREPTLKGETSAAPSDMTLTELVSWISSGEFTNPKAMGDATYFTCQRVLAQSMGKLPLKLVRKTESDGTEQLRGDPLYPVFRLRPNPFTTAASFQTSMEFCKNEYGNSYAWMQPHEKAMRLWQLPSQQVRIWWDNAKLLSAQAHIWYIWSAPDGKQYPFSEEEIIHFRTWYSLDGITGLPVRDILKLTIGGAVESQKMLNRLYSNGMAGKAVVQYTGDINPEKQKAFVLGLEEFIDSKDTGTRSLIPVPIGSTITPLDIKLADAQYLELRKFTALQVAGAFGVKPDQINDYTKSSYSSSEAQQLAFLVETLMWTLENNQQEYDYKALSSDRLAKGDCFEYNTAVVLKADTKTQIDAITAAIGGSLYTPDEGRNFIGMRSKPGGDKLYSSNGSIIPLEDAGKQYEKKGENTNA